MSVNDAQARGERVLNFIGLGGIDPIGTRSQKLFLVVDLTQKRPKPMWGSPIPLSSIDLSFSKNKKKTLMPRHGILCVDYARKQKGQKEKENQS